MSNSSFAGSNIHRVKKHNLRAILLTFLHSDSISRSQLAEQTGLSNTTITNLTAATHFMSTLRQEGCRFALDDFGSGLSSFTYLKWLPIDYVKVDGAFVRDIVDDPVDRAMVQSINQMGHVLEKNHRRIRRKP